MTKKENTGGNVIHHYFKQMLHQNKGQVKVEVKLRKV